MPRAVILGGTGAIGTALSARLLEAGWTVEVTGRDPTHVPPSSATFHAAGRADLAGLIGAGVDLLVDCVCYTAEHARPLVPLLGSVRVIDEFAFVVEDHC